MKTSNALVRFFSTKQKYTCTFVFNTNITLGDLYKDLTPMFESNKLKWNREWLNNFYIFEYVFTMSLCLFIGLEETKDKSQDTHKFVTNQIKLLI